MWKQRIYRQGTLEVASAISQASNNFLPNFQTFQSVTLVHWPLKFQRLKVIFIDSLKGDIHTVVDQRTRELELEDRKRKEFNITVFNLKDQNYESGTENKRADELDVRAKSASLGLENLSISTTYRLRRKEEGKIRPLRVVLDSKSQRKYLIDNARHISKKVPEAFQRVIIAKG